MANLLVPRLRPYPLVYVPARRPYAPTLVFYRPLRGHTVAVAVTNAYKGFDGQRRYRLMFEADTEEDYYHYSRRLYEVLDDRVRLIVTTQHGYHVYTSISSTDPEEILRLLRWVYYYGLCDYGYLKLAEKRVAEGQVEHGFLALRVGGKYAYPDLHIRFMNLGDDQWMKRVVWLIDMYGLRH